GSQRAVPVISPPAVTGADDAREPQYSNLRSLRKIYREYADVLSAVPSAAHFVFARAGSSVACRHVDGRWIHGPADPWAAAREEAAKLVDAEAALYIVLRPGLGYLGFAILEEIEKRSPDSFVVLVEDRLDLLARALSVVDWTPLIESVTTELLL